MSDDAPDVGRFDALRSEEAKTLLGTCLDVPRWVAVIESGRPYASWPALRAAATTAADSLTEEEVETALARHPRIGERAGAGHDAAHSEREQSAVDPQDREVAARLEAGNSAYEDRFGRVFLIRAAGRSAQQILAELDRRLSSSVEQEQAETVTQLREIALLRLESVV
ncbi:MAG: 2-oxo-4-hydroxy-4-carboxy-5-ureidoimidazoline decarboxylase [Actinomycetota bacterium]|nr:2-oxo-4-hydroxy-4-carboxy-5-ureidoimidazoline decarboxylase [Actinomycetota bacterium]